MQLPEIFAANVKRLMAAKQPPWTQTRLSEMVGISQSNIATMLKGSTWPQHERIQKVAEALGVPALALLAKPGEIESVPVRVPIYAVVGAGGGKDDPPETGETLDVSARCEGTTAVKVRGESMIRAGIYNSDIVTVRPKPAGDYENGELVVAWIADQEGHVLKQLHIGKKGVRTLLPRSDNDEHQTPILFDDTRDKIIGSVTAIFPGDPSPPRDARGKGKRGTR